MTRFVIAAALLVAVMTPAAAQPDDLTATTLKIERAYGMTHALLAIDNPNDGYDWATFSCVLTVEDEPVFEAPAWIEKIVARGRTIKRSGFLYKGPADKIECRPVTMGPQR